MNPEYKLDIKDNRKRTIIALWEETADWPIFNMSRPPFNQTEQAEHQAVRFLVGQTTFMEIPPPPENLDPDNPNEVWGTQCLSCGAMFFFDGTKGGETHHHAACPVPTLLAMLDKGLGISIIDPADFVQHAKE